jgi:hypothetical protein
LISEVFEAIEKAAAEISIQDPLLSEEFLPVEKLWIAAKFHGATWDVLTAQFENEEISPELYRDCVIELVKEFGRYRFNRNIEKILIGMNLVNKN